MSEAYGHLSLDCHNYISAPFMYTGILNAVICQSDKNKSKNSALLSLLLPWLVSSVFVAVGAPHLTLYQSQDVYKTPVRSGRTLMHWDNRIININDKLYVAGYVFGVFSAAFHVFARVPQIVKNVSFSFMLSLCVYLTSLSLSTHPQLQFMRCSVEGLSIHMFILSILGNVTYGLGILLYSVDGIFLLQKLPWLIGSLGTMIFDITVSFSLCLFQ